LAAETREAGEEPSAQWVRGWTARLEGWGAGRWLSALRWVRKGLVLVLGASVVGLGLVLLVTPGPAFLVIPAGLAILATEFYWARRLLRWLKQRASQALTRPQPTLHSPGAPTQAGAAPPARQTSACDGGANPGVG